jgi:hypothetical protein
MSAAGRAIAYQAGEADSAIDDIEWACVAYVLWIFCIGVVPDVTGGRCSPLLLIALTVMWCVPDCNCGRTLEALSSCKQQYLHLRRP